MKAAVDLKLPIYFDSDHRSLSIQDKVLTNSESCLSLLEKENPSHPFTKTAKMVKNKAGFRKFLASVYPDYYFRLLSLDDLMTLDKKEIPFPVVVKPNKGYSSIGVYIVETEQEWENAVKSLYADMLLSANTYSNAVIDGAEIIIEEWIDGEEFAVDCYFNDSGKPVILNILTRTFLNNQDTSDRIYYTSKEIIADIKADIEEFLQMLSKRMDMKNFPFHLEVRKSSKGVRAIELNPLRFAGAGTTDVSHHAFDVNGAAYYFTGKEPNWERILQEGDQSYYGFFCAEIPPSISQQLIEGIDHDRLRDEFSHVLEYRKIQANNDRTFAVIFFKTDDLDELQHLLHLDLSQYIQVNKVQETIL
ncbi:ATP-grasp domain-containing protein [Bacillus sp. KH172YL63]|nr:ATP-grasp domain-containing protein [Bacillus sp. KH172YL63]